MDVDIELNPYQESAAVDALLANDVFCIHGPPGTGKTRTLVAIIEQAVKNEERVLVTAHSNQAVDNIVIGDGEADRASLNGVVRSMGNDNSERDISLIRPSSSTRELHPTVRERYFVDTQNLPDTPAVDIVATTTNTAAAVGGHFDLVVVDEASQASCPATSIPFGRGGRTIENEYGYERHFGLRTILAGDHKQLPPYVADREMQRQGLHKSLFEHLVSMYGSGLSQTLYRQYRMHEDIAQFPNEEFYDDELEHGDANRQATLENLRPIRAIHHTSPDQQDEGDYSYYNSTEAAFVAAQVQKALNTGVEPAEVGVITAYGRQQEKINDKLGSTLGGAVAQEVNVATIDRFQGGQREVIIVSFVRSNTDADSGFLEDPPVTAKKRLNVALTRAKKRLVLIGDWDTLSTTASFRDESDSCADTYHRLREYLLEKDAMVSQQ
nr:AAA domain-containing protein [Halomarina rubra]